MKNRLFNIICDLKNLYRAWKKVRQKGAGGGIDGITLQDFEKRLQHNLDQIQNALIKESYIPFPAKRIYIPKSKPGEKRALALPVIRDKIVQETVRNVIEPIFNSMFFDIVISY